MHPCLLDQLERLASAADREQQAEATRPGPNTKLAAHLWSLMLDEIPANPADPRYRLGDVLGSAHRHWHRGKTGHGRYRLFYRFDSTSKVIVFAWVNDDKSLRTYGSSTDAYAVFRSMLERGNPPDDWNRLAKAAMAADQGKATGLIRRKPK